MIISFSTRSAGRRYRTTKDDPCPVCGGERCMLYVGGERCSRCSGTGKWRGQLDCAACAACAGTGKRKGGVVCRRITGGKLTGGGSYFPAESEWQPIAKKPSPPPQSIRASIERRHRVYSALLSVLPLHGHHADHLTQVRRLSEETITNNQFASVPSREEGDALAREFARHVELCGIPGFWRRFGEWVMSFSGTPGFFLPIRNLAGQIEALQIRTDAGKSKYLLFSSTDRPDGCSSGAPAHFARVGRETVSVVITEGALKAEVIAERLCAPVVGLVAVGTFQGGFGAQLKRELPALRQVLVAFDADWQSNDKVATQLARLQKSLTAAGLHAEALTWEGEQKGFDDYLLELEVA